MHLGHLFADPIAETARTVKEMGHQAQTVSRNYVSLKVARRTGQTFSCKTTECAGQSSWKVTKKSAGQFWSSLVGAAPSKRWLVSCCIGSFCHQSKAHLPLGLVCRWTVSGLGCEI